MICIPKLALEIQDISLLALLLSPRLDDILSMCFVHYRSWIVCTLYNAAPVLLVILMKFLMRMSAFPLRPRYICCSTTHLLPSLSKKLLDHFGVIINNPFVTPAVIFLINNRNFHSDVCNGSCLFLHIPYPAGVDVFEQQAPNNHSVHVHVLTPCINSSFVCIVCPLALNRYCGIACEFLSQTSKLLFFAFPPIEAGCSSIVLSVHGICG